MKYALLIGLNYSSTNSKLFGCINDCLLVQSMLINNYGYDPNNIVLMRDDIYISNNLLYPNKNNIINQIKQLISKSNLPNCDSIYLHFSGHGSQIKDTNGDEKDGLDEFIVPRDYFINRSCIIDDELYSLVISVKDNIPFFLIFDCCNSGSMLDLNYNYSYVNNNVKLNNDTVSVVSKKKIICISACLDNQSALDVTVKGSSNGALTLALYSALQSSKWNILLKDLLKNIYTFLAYNKYTNMSPVISSTLLIDFGTQLFHNVINASVIIESKPNTTSTTTKPTQTPTPNTSTNTLTNQSNVNNNQPVNSIVNILSNGVANSNPSNNNTSTSQTTPSKPEQSNISNIKSLMEHLISTKYISIDDLKSVISTLK